MSFSSVSCAACGAVRLSQALTIVTVRVFGALLDFILRDTDTPAWACAVRARGVLCTNAFCGSEAARRLGPTPRGRLKFGRILACRTRTTQNRRVEGAHRSVTGPLSAASARDMRPSAREIERERVPWPVRRMARSRMYTTHTTLNTHANDMVHAKRGPHRRWVITSGLTRGVAFTLRKRASAGVAR